MYVERKGPLTVQLPDGTAEVRPGVPVGELLVPGDDTDGSPWIAAVVNNRLVSLDAPICVPSVVRPVTVRHPEGAQVYRRTATYLLFAAFIDVHPELRLEIGQSMGNGYHFQVTDAAGQAAEADVDAVSARMRALAEEDAEIAKAVLTLEEAIGLFEDREDDERLHLLRVWPSSHVHVVFLRRFADIQHGPVALSTGCVDDFSLEPLEPGFVLTFSLERSPTWHDRPWDGASKLFGSYKETRGWNAILGVRNVGDLNERCLVGRSRELIHIAEGLQEKKIASIADQITARLPDVRVVLIAGPSSSGKTTFSKRLGTQLRVNGVHPVALSMDDYYVDRADTPRHPDGRYDFESIEAVDLALFNDHLEALLSGAEVRMPRFDFQLGKRSPPERWRPLRLSPDQVLVIEGIHGLNPRLTEAVPLSAKFRVYVSALTQLVIDRANRVGTSDVRLVRRIVRDRRYRGYSAAQTLAAWPSVRQGELTNIFPYQEQCEVMFNSALVYEPAVLKILAERYLLEVPRDHPSAVKAHALRKFLQLFVPIFPDDVPRTSILREFIGGSAFDY